MVGSIFGLAHRPQMALSNGTRPASRSEYHEFPENCAKWSCLAERIVLSFVS